MKFLYNPKIYLEKNLMFKGLKDKSTNAPEGYPVVALGDISLNMMHYKTFEQSINHWDTYKKTINWENVFVVTCTENPNVLQKFNELPYNKKACFVPFKSELDSAWYLTREVDKEAKRLVDAFLNFGDGKFFYYDPFDMVLYGKKTLLIDR